MIEKIIELDKQLFIYLNGMGVSSWDGFWLYMSKTLSFVTIPIFLFILFYSFYKLGLKKAIVMIVVVVLLILSTEQLSIFIKQGVGRLRPCYNTEILEIMRMVKSYCGGKYSYFSAHAANSFAFASFFALLFKKQSMLLGILLFLWALLVSYSRIYIGVHFPLDVITGILIGLFFGFSFAKLPAVFFKIVIKEK